MQSVVVITLISVAFLASQSVFCKPTEPEKDHTPQKRSEDKPTEPTTAANETESLATGNSLKSDEKIGEVASTAMQNANQGGAHKRSDGGLLESVKSTASSVGQKVGDAADSAAQSTKNAVGNVLESAKANAAAAHAKVSEAAESITH